MQSGSNEDDVWITDSGASCHMTHDRTRIYNVRPPPSGRETITIEDRPRIKVEYIGNMDVIFHGKTDQRITLMDVVYGPGLGFNLYSLHAAQRTHLIVSGRIWNAHYRTKYDVPPQLLLLLLLFLTFSVLVANPKKLLYTVANPARGLLNKEKRTKEKVWQHTPPHPHTARSEKINKNTRRIYRRYAGLGRSRARTRIPSARRLGQWMWLRKILHSRLR